MDHLFLDQDAIPTIVEVKRGADTRIRREFVGQMLDYAANAVVYWPVEARRARFEGAHRDPLQSLTQLLDGYDVDPEEFWLKVKTNLQAGRVRMIFVSDRIPLELRRVVEFLNGQMQPAEVLAVEIRQYVGQGMRTLVPRLVGQIVESRQKKSAGTRGADRWGEAPFLEDLEARYGPAEATAAREILEWARSRDARIWWGRGKTEGSFVPALNHGGVDHQLFAVWSGGQFEFYFQHYRSKPPFDEEEKRLALLEELNSVPAVSIPPDAHSRRPSVHLSSLVREGSVQRLLGTFDRVIQRIREV